MDAERLPGPGARAAGLVAFEDRFDGLAASLLDQLESDPADLEVRVARQILAWRSGALGLDPDFLASGTWRQSGADIHRHRLLKACVEYSLPHEAALLLEAPVTSQGDDGAAVTDASRWLRRLQANTMPLELASANAVALHLPCGEAPRAPAPEAGLRAWAVGRRWWPWSRAIGAASALGAYADRVPGLPAGQVAVVDAGCLDRYTARHWIAVLRECPTAVITRLTVHDPAARSEALLEALRRHEPVGVVDLTSWLLFREWGVRSVVMGPVPHGVAADTTFDLWADATTPAWVATWDRIVTRTISGATDSKADLRARWIEATREAVLVDETTSATWAPPHAAFNADTLRREVLVRRLTTHSSTEQEAIELAFAVDAGLADEFPVVLESCLAHAGRPVQCHVMLRGVPDEVLEQWARLFAGRVGLTAHVMDAVHITDEPRLIAHTTESTLDRLLLPWLLPSVPRVVYLDVDLIVMADLEPLWRTDLQGCPLAAKPGSSPGTRWGLQMLYRAVGQLPPPQARAARMWLHRTGLMAFRAFNAGVLVMDLERMRQADAVSTWLSLVAHAAMNDQDVLNAWTREGYLPLQDAWNAAPRQDPTQGAKIIHFVGPVKPWHELYISRKREYERVREQVDRRRKELGID